MTNQFEARDYGYTIISRFEEVLRNAIQEYCEISAGDYEEYIPKGVKTAAYNRNSEIDSLETLLESIEFIHLKEIIVYNKNYTKIIQNGKLAQEAFSSTMDSLYALRCKIAHIRDYFTSSDLTFLINESCLINAALNNYSDSFEMFTKEIMNNPQTLVKKTPIEFYTDENKIINNLPMPDYEYEGGYVGRGEDIEKIIKMLQNDRIDVITIAGAGGVGKSALALKAVNEVINRNLIKYDFVVWVSAKENKLSYLGIEDIEPTLKNYEELLDTILNVLDFDLSEYENSTEKKEEDIFSLLDACDKVLIIIDNLETITDERIINFILDGHRNVQFLITSRRGLGQVERRHELKELKEKDAIQLFRVICREKGLNELQKADDKLISTYVKKVFCYPLAIKWVLGQAAMGKDISQVISSINEKSSDISQFCFEQVFSELNKDAKNILYTLCLENDAVPQGVLKYISNLDDKVFEDTIWELQIVSLILPEQRVNKNSNEINSYYSLLPLTRGYVKVQLDKNIDEKERLQERMMTVDNTLEEADRAKAQYRFSLSNFGAVTEEEKIASVLAQTAYQKHQAGSYADAIEIFKKAVNIAPSFAPIYRNWAMIESMESHWSEADDLMEKASKLNPNDTQIWLVWGNMKRKNDKIKEAYAYYQKAYQLSPKDNVVLNSYAQAISRMGNYSEADILFRQALELVEGVPHNKHLIINNSSIAENLRKWAESLIEDRDYENAKHKLEEARKAIELVLKLDRFDEKAKTLYADIWGMYSVIYEKQDDYDMALFMLKKQAELTQNSTRIKTIRTHARAILRMIQLLIVQNKLDEASEVLAKSEKDIKRDRDERTIEKHRKIKERLNRACNERIGTIVQINKERKFLIIEDDINHERYLTFLNAFKEYIYLEEDLLGKKVNFSPIEEGEKHRAENVSFVRRNEE
ncbi:MAG: NB-ARC domain-containing protein [Lachnospiraceae bacterium]|nr:NB-ARC domain-containing protein [Lachnospiraceae bacterium]